MIQRALLLLSLAVAACGPAGPAAERGFFGGWAAAISGEDEARASRMEREAQAAEARALEARAQALRAERERERTAAQLRDAELRLARLEARLASLRRDLAAARASRSDSDGGRGESLAQELDRLDRDRAAAARAPNPDAVRRLEQGADELSRALDAYRRL